MSEVSSEAVEAARQAAYQMYVTDEGQTLATRDLTNAIADAALTAALPYLAAHQPARVVPSAEEVRAQAERQYPRRGPAVGFTWDDDMRAAFVYGAAWATRTETKGGE